MKKIFDVILGTLDVTECTAVNPDTGNREFALVVKGNLWDAPTVVFGAKMPESQLEALELMTDAVTASTDLETVEIL